MGRFRQLARRVARAMTRHVVQQKPNQQYVVDDWSNVLMGCCDCGLMHRFEFTMDEHKRLVIRGRRDVVATKAQRAARDFPFRPAE